MRFGILFFLFVTSMAQADLLTISQELARGEQHSIRNLHQWQDSLPKQAAACTRDYGKIFADGVYNISISLGYNDSPESGFVLDQETFQMLTSALTSPCVDPLDTVCGFSPTERPYASVSVFEKQVYPYEAFGVSDAKIRIEIAQASWSNVDAENFLGNELRAEQIQTSKAAEAQFLESLSGQGRAKCDLCVYMGHARNGGGPDFYPVPLAWANSKRKPNYAFYLKERLGFRKLIGALNQRNPAQPGVLALLGCNSLSKFYPINRRVCENPTSNCKGKSLRDFSNQLGFVLTDDLSWPSNRSSYFAATLEAALSFKCRSSWEKNYLEISGKGAKPESYRLLGRFLSVD